MTQSFTRFLRALSVVLLTVVCTTRLGATPVASNLALNAGSGSSEFTTTLLTTSPGDNTGTPGVGAAVNLTPVHVLCYNAKTGSITATVSGDGPFTFAWSNGKTTQNIQNLGAGTYSVTVTDVDGDITVASTTVNQPDPIVAYITCINVCPGACNGYATVTVLSGGVGPFTYQWSTGSTASTISGLCPGIYWVTITDANNCKKIVGSAVTQSSAVVISGTATNGTCANPCSGTITQSVSGAHAPYTFVWSDGGATTKDRTGLCPGTYSVTVTSANNCTASATYVVSAPPAIYVDVNPQSPLCPEGTGTASAVVSGGSGSHAYLWSNGATTASISNLTGGSYCVTVTDSQGCTASACGSISIPNGFTVSVDSTTCNPWPGTACSGTAAVTPNGGAAPFTYAWSNGATGDHVTNLCTGTHTVIVTDANGCTASTSVEIEMCPPVPCVPAAQIIGSVVCGQTSTTLSVVGGFNPATAIYVWTKAGVPGVQGTGATLVITSSGTYNVNITDSITPCISNASITIEFLPNPMVDITTTNVNCYGGANGSATAIVDGGSGPYTFTWNTGATGSSISGLAAANYCVTVVDANECSAVACEDVNQPTELTIATSGTNGTCVDPCSGTASVSVAGGTSPYSIVWSNGGSGNTISGLCAGTYGVTVYDAHQCSATGSVVVTAPEPFTINVSSTNPTCFGYSNGSASVTVIGGTAPFTYNWSNGKTTATITNIGAGSYHVTVTDANGCTATGTANLVAPPKIIAYVNCIKTCPGQCTGQAFLTVIGGTPPYTYEWSTGATTQNVDSLCAAVYWVTITDANGCKKIVGAAVLPYPAINLSGNVTNILCSGQCTGAIALNVSGGGVSTYTYAWSNGATTKNLSNLCAGQYCVTVTTVAGCTATQCFQITATPPVAVTVNAESPLCAPGTGTASANVTGGTAPYSYLWSTGATTSSVSGLSAGSVCVTVTDANGCTASACDVVTIPDVLTVTASGTNLLCYQDNSGTASASANGGTGIVTYLWSNGATTSSITGLAAGQYCVTVTDQNDCTASACVVITQPTAVTVELDNTDVDCYGNATGTAIAFANGGTTPYTFVWNNGATTSSLSGLVAGQYCVTVTDAHGCTASDCVTVNQPDLLVVNAYPTNVTCPDACDGAATVSISGGTAPYVVNWSNGHVGGGVTGLCPGTYTFTVTDANQCTAAGQVTIGAPQPIVFTSVATDVDCYNGWNGTITVSANGGTAPLAITWFDGSSNWTITNLSAGNYCFTITDANGCTVTGCKTINEPEPLLAYSECPVLILCPDDCTGVIDVTVVGGTAPYTFLWSDGAITEDRDDLCPGIYSVTITDANDCTYDLYHVLENPEPIAVYASATDVTCPGYCDGTATASATGGTGDLSIVWSNGATSWSINELCPGTYSFTVTDANDCTASGQVTVGEPADLVVTSESTDVDCYNGWNGTATASASGGTAPYTIVWSNGENTWTITDLSAGEYCFTVTDAHGCTAEGCETINEPEPLLAYSECPVLILCPDDCTGEINVTVVGGTAPYTFLWNDGATTKDREDLCPGIYNVTITDANDCTYDLYHVLENPEPIEADASSTNVTCYDYCNGTISVVAVGGTGDLSIVWSNSALNGWNVNELCAGQYCFTITDDNGCTYTECIVIGQPQPVSVVVTGVDVLCPTGANAASGSASALASGGTGSYSYSWNTGATTSSISGLSTGTYCVTVTDANGCTASDCDDVNAPAPLEIDVTSTDVDCYGNETGSVSVVATGGTAPYTYQWNNGATTASAVEVAAGIHCVTVTDANGCTAQDCVEVTQPLPLEASANPTDVTCPGYCDGAATVWISGGTAPYSVNWSNGNVGGEVIGLCAGTYYFTVTDANGCWTNGQVTIGEPEELGVEVTVVNILCADDNNGEISVVANGGTAPYTIVWADGGSGWNREGLAPGDYCFTVTDANGCTIDGCGSIAEPAPLLAYSVCPIPVLCPGECNAAIYVTVIGGTPPYSFIWNDGVTTEDREDLCPGQYDVTITDANGCEFHLVHNIGGAEPIELLVTGTDDTNCLNPACDGTATASVVDGGTAPFEYSWSNGSTDATITGLCPGTYNVTVVDANGCTASGEVTIDCVPPPPCSPAITINGDVVCGQTEVELTLNGVLNTGAAEYNWSTGETTASIVVDENGLYSVTVIVTDSINFNYCISVDSIYIEFYGNPTASTVATDVNCYNGWDGTIDLTISGGTTPYTVIWSDGSNDVDRDNLPAGIYCYTVVDANGCSTTGCDTINEPEPLLGYVDCPCPITFCPGECSGEINLTVVGGVGPFTFNWSNGATTEDLSGLCAGFYVVTITDANGCTFDVAHAPFEESTPIETFHLVVKDTNCEDAICDGSVSISIGGGTAPYVVEWSNGHTGTLLSGLCPDTYSYTITDALGCSIDGTVTVGCDTIPVECAPLRTQTQGGWGQNPSGSNQGVYLHANFDLAFPEGVTIGCINTLTLTSAQAVTNWLPSGSTASALPAGALVDPNTGSNPDYDNVFAAQLTAAVINVGFDAYDPNFGGGSQSLGGMYIASGDFAGWTVNQLIEAANLAIGGCGTGGYTFSQYNDALSAINENYVDGTSDDGFLVCDPPASGFRADQSVVVKTDVTIAAYPNPFTVNSNIVFTSNVDDVVTLEVFSVTGQKVAEPFRGTVKANETITVTLNGGQMADGMYIYRLVTSGGAYTGNLVRAKN